MPETYELAHTIGGVRSGKPVASRQNPADPDDLVSNAPVGDASTVDDAITAATDARGAWSRTPPPVRGAILEEAARILDSRIEQVAADLTREEGKTLAEARGEVRRAVEILRFHGGQGWRLTGDTIPSSAVDQLVYTVQEPIGVVAVITPWNFPIAIPAWKIAPALVAGNTVVFKPASLTGVSAHHLVEVLHLAGLPNGVINLVYGSGRTVGNGLVEDQRVDGVTFTGSTSIGREIHAKVSARMGRVQLEMGGKNPLIVLDDADPARAATIAAAGAFGLTGQACTATSRVIVTPGIADEFTEALISALDRYQPGNGLAEGVGMGPVVSADQLRSNLDYLDIARNQGATVIAGGSEPHQLFMTPTVLGGVERSHRVAQEEVFGPVLAILSASSFDDAIDQANDVPYGLTAGICTQNLESALRFVDSAQAGVVKVNRPTTGLELNAPFGGIKDSSTGTYREQGARATDFFSRSKTVYLGYS